MKLSDLERMMNMLRYVCLALASQFISQIPQQAIALESCLERGNTEPLPAVAPRPPGPADIGIAGSSLTPQAARAWELDEPRGLVVVGTEPGDPAYEGGVRKGDLITKLNGYLVPDGPTFTYTINGMQLNTRITVEIYRHDAPDGEKCQTLTILLDNNPFR